MPRLAAAAGRNIRARPRPLLEYCAVARSQSVIVGVSGGVDSAVAALRLRDAGYDVQGLHMTNWRDDDPGCTAASDYQAARQVCQDLEIPMHHVDFSEAYRQQVFAGFLAEYRAGRTPNPDVLCNRHIKFGAFIEHALKLGADWVATGHYARIQHVDGPRLLTSADAEKDQTYFLHAVHGHAFSRVLFPLGDITKEKVRQIASSRGLPNHARRDSTGICFIGERPFREFLKQYLEEAPGPIETAEGEVVGQHPGLMFFTLGQRSGIGIGGRRAGSAEAWYVAEKDPTRNALIVVQGRENTRLWSAALKTGPMHWINGMPAATAAGNAFRCRVRIRHRHHPAESTVTPAPDGRLMISFDEPQWAVAPGQFAVLYLGQECLGGAVIDCPAAFVEH